MSIDDLLDKAETVVGFPWFKYQRETFHGWHDQATSKACLYYKTGAGKSVTSLFMMHMRGRTEVLVVAPPSTHPAWKAWGQRLSIDVDTISHAKFRMKDYKLSRTKAVIVDEFHMLGGHGGKGFSKLDRLAKHLQAPLIICSATPNYNDAERVYCVKHVLDPLGTKGGYLAFLYANCKTEADPFSMTPKVTGFHHYPDAAAFLADLPGVYYLEDDLVYDIEDIHYSTPLPAEFESHGYYRREHRMIASAMERRHAEVNLRLIDDNVRVQPHVLHQLDLLLASARGSVLVYCNHATVALVLADSLRRSKTGLVTGGLSTKAKAEVIARFKRGVFPVLIGTASLATGTDGLDKMCDTLIILDDTDDDSLRRQLIGRIMPRGADTDASKKKVYRFVSD